MSTDATDAARRARLLDAVRGVAVLWVIAYHAYDLVIVKTRPEGRVGEGWWLVGAGSLAVDIFFVLSGFLLVGSWKASREKTSSMWAAAKDYGRKRALRILPAFWVSLAVLVPLAAPHLIGSVRDIGLLASVQQYLDPELPGQVNIVYWTLTTEVHFYLLLPVLALLLRRFGGKVLIPACIGVGLVWRLWTPEGLAEGMILGRADQFAVGMAAAGLVAAADRGAPGRIVRLLLRRHAGWLVGSAFLAVALYMGSAASRVGPLPGKVWVHPLSGLLVGALIIRMVLSVKRSSAVLHPAVGTLATAGVISYSLYLWHYPILQHGLGLTDLDVPAAAGGAVLAGLAVLFVLIGVVATLSYRYVERPFLERKHKRTTAPAEPAERRVPVAA